MSSVLKRKLHLKKKLLLNLYLNVTQENILFREILHRIVENFILNCQLFQIFLQFLQFFSFNGNH